MRFFRGLLIGLPPSITLWLIVIFGRDVGWQSSLVLMLCSLAAAWAVFEMSEPQTTYWTDDWLARRKRRIARRAEWNRFTDDRSFK